MRKLEKISYISVLVIAVAVLCGCQSNETRKQVKAATPSDPVIINKTTTTRLDKVDEGFKSGMTEGYAWVNGNGVFVTITEDNENPDGKVENETTVGGRTQSNGRVLLDTIPCGESFIDPVFTLTGNPTTEDISNADSIGAKTVKSYTGTDGQQLTLEDLYKYLSIEATLPTPRFEASSKIAEKNPVRFDETNDENIRIVWIKVEVKNEVEGTVQGEDVDQSYEVGYVQTKTPAVTPIDPLKIKMNLLEMFRTYRKNTQHSIMDMWMSFTVVNAKTGETTDEVETDSRMAAKIGHFGAPSNGYSLEEKRLIGSAPTEVTEELDPTNEEAKAASKQMGKFNFKVECYKQQYYLRFPVRGRDDSEGGKEAGGERLLFQLNGSYVDPGMDYTFNFQITHRTEVVIKGWQEITPSYQRPDDPGIHYEYLSSYVVEFIDHLYLNGEEIVWVDSDEGVFYYLVPSQNGKNIEVQNPDYELYYTGNDAHPFHTSTMVVDGWKPSFE